jgi:1,4-dihydroxy-2-naphthoate polyprenyltransferase
MRVVDAFFALRPMVLVPAWSFFLLGHAAARHDAPFPALRLACFTLVMLGVHLVNQVMDRETDRINDKGYFLQRGIFAPRDYAIGAIAGLAAGLGIASAAHASAGLLGVAAALGLAYSVPPLRLAARPGLDLVSNAAGYGVVAPLLGAGAAPDGAPGFSAAFLTSTACAVGAVFIHTTLLDVDGDRRTGKRTIGLVAGPRVGRALGAFLALAAAVWAVRTPWPLFGASALLAIVATGAAWIPGRISSRTVCVAATGAYGLAAGIVWPPFLVALFILAVTTRAYYARRFGLRYPAL